MREQTLVKQVGGERCSGFRRGFTLIELLVVVGIIGLLLAILVPSLSGVRDRAKAVATQSQIAGLTTGLESYKTESSLGGSYPPSKSDDDPTLDPPSDQIADPLPLPSGLPNSGAILHHTAGASLLVYALNGADGLGTPGFVDINGDDKWSDDFGVDDAYAISEGNPGDLPAGEPMVTRYGPFAESDPLLKSIKSVGELVGKGIIREPPSSLGWGDTLDGGDYKHKVFTDQWGYPILYYRARRGARAIIPTTNPKMPGIYDPYDNLAIIGKTAQNGSVIANFEGLYPGKGGAAAMGHPLAYFTSDLEPAASPAQLDPASDSFLAKYANSFEQYILDKSVTGRPTPLNKNSFLLISAGTDGFYGTADDVTNFGNR
ncbi:MAG: type II secretion system protein [Phycisphaerae bacterium]|nr:type II secretion system protein [Phycisphaerae bacterium]